MKIWALSGVLGIVLALSGYFLIDAHQSVKANESAINGQKVTISALTESNKQLTGDVKELRTELRKTQNQVNQLKTNADILPYKYGLKEVK